MNDAQHREAAATTPCGGCGEPVVLSLTGVLAHALMAHPDQAQVIKAGLKRVGEDHRAGKSEQDILADIHNGKYFDWLAIERDVAEMERP
jgi:hypothetical protein